MNVFPREPVVHAEDFTALVRWYCDVLGFIVKRLFEDGYHYANLESPGGVQLGIADAAEMGVEPGDRGKNTVVLQFEVEDVPAFLTHVAESGGRVLFGPSHDASGGFWYGAFADLEGNPCWVVDRNCP